MKHLSTLKSLLLVLFAVLGGGNVWGETWTRCTTVDELLAGGTYIIGYEATANSGVIVPMQNDGTATASVVGILNTGTTAGSSKSTTIDMSSVSETSLYEVTISGSTVVDGAIAIKCPKGYVGNANTKNNLKFFTSESKNTSFTPTVGANDVFTLTITANTTYTTLQYNTSSPRFAVYSGTQKNVVIYKKQVSESSVEAPTFTVPSGTYTETQTVKVDNYSSDYIYAYTTDGSEPAFNGLVVSNGTEYDHEAGIEISSSCTLKMIACDLKKVSPVKTATYTITVPDATNIMALRAKGKGTYNVMLTDAVVTYVNNKNAYIEDATGGLLIYASHSLKAGDKINGQVSVVLIDYNGTDEATTFDISKATVTSDNVIPVTSVTLEELLAEGGMKKYESMRVCVSGIKVVTPIASQDGIISQSKNQIAVREGVKNCLSTTCLMTANAMANVIGYPTTYSTKSQLKLWNASAVEEIPTVTVSDAGYATYYNSAKAYTMPAGCEGYVFYDGKLATAYDAEAVVPANEPLVIKAEAGTYVLNFTTSKEDTWKSLGMNDLEGTDEETALTAEDSYYFYALSLNAAGELSSVGFYWMNETGAAFTNGAHKAYLKLAKGNGAAVKGFAFNDLETAIQEVEANTACGALYDLSGRKVNKAQKGIYIINGKKVVK